MKKLSLSFFFICCVSFARAQHYTFSQSTGTYIDIVTSTISQPGWDYMDSYNLGIAFPFLLGGLPESMIGVSGKGIAGFQFGTRGISALNTDLKEGKFTTNGASTIGYRLEGNPGQQVLIIQWRNAGFADDGTNNDFVNFQMWLYEGSNKIEIHYGPSSITSASTIFYPAQGPTVGLALATNTSNFTVSGVYLQGNPASATAVTLNNTNTYPQLTALPADGTIYTFTPAIATGVIPAKNQNPLAIYPNPTNGEINIHNLSGNGPTLVKIYNILGKIIASKSAYTETNLTLDLENARPGTYFVEIISKESRQIKKIVKK